MKVIHVVDPAVNYYPMYSVEYKPKKNPHPTCPEVWSQHGLTPHKGIARVLNFETWLRYGRDHDRRVRVL